MEDLSALATEDGLDSDGRNILGKGSLQEAETGVVVPVGIFHTQKELSHTPILRQVQLGMLTKFKRQVLQWGGVNLPMKEPSGLLGKLNQTSLEMREVVMHTAESVSTREATEILVKILDSTYAESDLKHVTNNATQMNAE